MEELKYSFKHQMDKSNQDHHQFDSFESDVEKVKTLRGLSKLKNLLKSDKLKNLFILQEVFKQK